MDIPIRDLVWCADLAGIIAFAISGAVVALRRGMDIFGMIVLAFLTAVAGGVIRDVLIGNLPPEAFQSWHNLAISIAVGVLVFSFGQWLNRIESLVRLVDALGLALFAVAGTEKALDWGIQPAMAAVLGVVTAIGGGIARDVLAVQVPTVLTSEIYAAAALLGAAVVAGGHAFGLPPTETMPVGAILCLLLRLVAMQRGWKLPAIASTAGDRLG